MNKWLKATETEKVSYLCSRWEELKRIRAPYLNRWQEISKYISPFSGKFNIKEHNQTRSSKYILDGEAGYDVDILCFVTDFCFEPFADLAYNKDL